MVHKLYLTNGKISETAFDIELEIIDKIENNEKLECNDLIVINVFKDDMGFNNYLLFKSTQKRLNLKDNYSLFENQKFDYLDSKIENELGKITNFIQVQKIYSYKYFKTIETVWNLFSIEFGYLKGVSNLNKVSSSATTSNHFF